MVATHLISITKKSWKSTPYLTPGDYVFKELNRVKKGERGFYKRRTECLDFMGMKSFEKLEELIYISHTLGREYRVMRNRYSRLLFTSEDRLCANLRVQEQSTNMTYIYIFHKSVSAAIFTDILYAIFCILLQWVTFNVAKNISGQLVYEGVVVEIVKALADTLNFRWVETGISYFTDVTLIMMTRINNNVRLSSEGCNHPCPLFNASLANLPLK